LRDTWNKQGARQMNAIVTEIAELLKDVREQHGAMVAQFEADKAALVALFSSKGSVLELSAGKLRLAAGLKLEIETAEEDLACLGRWVGKLEELRKAAQESES
jgi:hypothetical protein